MIPVFLLYNFHRQTPARDAQANTLLGSFVCTAVRGAREPQVFTRARPLLDTHFLNFYTLKRVKAALLCIWRTLKLHYQYKALQIPKEQFLLQLLH